MYDSLPSSLLDVDPKEIDDQTFVLGAQLDKNSSLLRNTNQYSLALILWHRLRRKDAECRTNDPSEADLFFVPIFPKPKKTSEWQRLCRNISYSTQNFKLKAMTRYCLEPAGDTPWRKSISDSIAMGCIPVTFSNVTADVAPWHWKFWRHEGQVHVPRLQFLQGEIDLKNFLV